jgi:hypothetical protein
MRKRASSSPCEKPSDARTQLLSRGFQSARQRVLRSESEATVDDAKKSSGTQRDVLGIGFGLFLILASMLTLAEYAGLIPEMKWGGPLFWLIAGGAILYASISKR